MTTVRDVMTSDASGAGPGDVTVRADASVGDAARLMIDAQVHHMAVSDDGEFVGQVSSFDLMKVLADRATHASGPTTSGMHAAVGDRIVIRGHAVGGHDRRGIIVEVRGESGAPPYAVQWLDDPHSEPHTVIFFPGNDAQLEHDDAAE